MFKISVYCSECPPGGTIDLIQQRMNFVVVTLDGIYGIPPILCFQYTSTGGIP